MDIIRKGELEGVLRLIDREPHRLLPEPFLRELLGAESYGRFCGAREYIFSADSDIIAEARAASSRPESVNRYLEELNAHMGNVERHRAIPAKVARAKKRFPVSQRRLVKLNTQLTSLEGQVASRSKWLWNIYDGMRPSEVAWCTCPPEHRTYSNHPLVYERAPWAVLFPDTPTPTNTALMVVLKELIAQA